jgi:hypothetical protein
MREHTRMSGPPNQPFRSAAHRKAVMQHLAASIVPSALAFGALAPALALILTGSGALAGLGASVANGTLAFGDALAIAGHALLDAYLVAGFAAAIGGVWIAVLSPFAPRKLQFYAGATAIGAMISGLFLIPLPSSTSIPMSPLFPLVGAIVVPACARLFTNWPLGRGEDGRQAHRDRLARQRAERLAKARMAS